MLTQKKYFSREGAGLAKNDKIKLFSQRALRLCERYVTKNLKLPLTLTDQVFNFIKDIITERHRAGKPGGNCI